MAVDTGVKKPTGCIVERGTPLVTYMKVETATSCKPGRLVKKDTYDSTVEICGDMGLAIGWLGYEQAHPAVKANASGLNGSVDGTYAANDIAPVLNGDFIIVASLKAAEVCTAGGRATPGASGEVTTFASGDCVVGIFMESKSYSGSSQDVLVKSTI